MTTISLQISLINGSKLPIFSIRYLLENPNMNISKHLKGTLNQSQSPGVHLLTSGLDIMLMIFVHTTKHGKCLPGYERVICQQKNYQATRRIECKIDRYKNHLHKSHTRHHESLSSTRS